MKIKRFFYLWIVGVLITRNAYACPACKEAIAKLGQAWTAIGFSWSVLFMLAVPLILIATFGGAIFLAIKKNSKS